MKKKKKVVWHKKTGSFIPSSRLKSHKEVVGDSLKSHELSPKQVSRKKVFAKNLLGQIKNAVEKSKE